MDHFESLRLFRTVVEVRNFRRAGQMLGISPAAVSRTTTSLEERLGARLFHRSTEQFSLTDVAHRFYDECCRVFDDLDCLESDARSQGHLPVGVLRLVAHTSATSAWLVPLVSSFKRMHPNLMVDVMLAKGAVDLVAEGYGIGLVLPSMLAADLAVTRMLQCLPLAIVVAPNYSESHVRPSHPADLSDHVFVTVPSFVHKSVVIFRTEGIPLVAPLWYEITSDNMAFSREVALAGLDMGLLSLTLVEDDLREGRLVRLFDDHEILDTAAEVRLAYINRTMIPARVRVFIDHAVAYFEEKWVAGSIFSGERRFPLRTVQRPSPG